MYREYRDVESLAPAVRPRLVRVALDCSVSGGAFRRLGEAINTHPSREMRSNTPSSTIWRDAVADRLRVIARVGGVALLVLPWLGCMPVCARPGFLFGGHGCLARGQVAQTGEQAPNEEGITESAACPGPCPPGAPALGPTRADMAQACYYNHPRFFPVPTRPVFSPLPYLADAHKQESTPIPKPPAPDPEPTMDDPLLPPPPKPEEIPTPSGHSGRLGDNGRADIATASPNSSWIFAPAFQPTAPAAQIQTVRQLPLETKRVR